MHINENDTKLIQLAKLLEHMRHVAKARREDAGYSGSWSDGGASSLLAECDAFEAGLNQTVPKRWQTEFERMKHLQDPEYLTYLKLHQKFKDITKAHEG
jgi:hypothetical protein